MKIYVASSLKNWSQVRELNAKLQLLGHEITYDWTEHGEKIFGDLRATPVLNFDTLLLQSVAIKEVAGVKSADLLLLVYPGGLGTYWEFGYSYARGKQIVIWGLTDFVVAEGERPVAFNHLPYIRIVTSEEAALSAVEACSM